MTVIDLTSNSNLIIITDTPENKMRGKMQNWDSYINNLSNDYYVKVLYDSRKDEHDIARIIGYDEKQYVNMSDDEILHYEIHKTFADIKKANGVQPITRGSYDSYPAFYE